MALKQRFFCAHFLVKEVIDMVKQLTKGKEWRLSRRNGQVWLLPENEAYEPIDGSAAELIGLVKAVIREY